MPNPTPTPDVQSMRVLVSGATRTMREYADDDTFGYLVTPRTRSNLREIWQSGKPWAADNDAFCAWDADRFSNLCRQLQGWPRLSWISCPDVVGDAKATLGRFWEWEAFIRQCKLPLAYVAQDGQSAATVPWDRIACLFIGGSTHYKLGYEAEQLAMEAIGRGKLVHMGRVNTARRFRHAYEIGCHTVDGTAFSRFPAVKFPRAKQWIAKLKAQSTIY